MGQIPLICIIFLFIFFSLILVSYPKIDRRYLKSNSQWCQKSPLQRYLKKPVFNRLPSWKYAYSLFKKAHWIVKNEQLILYDQKNLVFVTISNFLISISLQPCGLNLYIFKLRLFDLTKFIAWKIYDIVLQRIKSQSLW